MAEEQKRKSTNNNREERKYRDQFSTHDGHPLTPKEAKFIDEYIKTGNGRQSVINAGYTDRAPAQKAQSLLNKAYITSEINYRLEQAKNASIADATEIMQYFTSVMRGEIADQFGLDASLSERTKAAQELAKRQIDIPNKLQGNEPPKLQIVVDWASGIDVKTGGTEDESPVS